MGAVHLPREQDDVQRERALTLRLARQLLGINGRELAHRVSERTGEDLGSLELLDMEHGTVAVPRKVANAALAESVASLDALQRLLESLRRVRREPNWPYPTSPDKVATDDAVDV